MYVVLLCLFRYVVDLLDSSLLAHRCCCFVVFSHGGLELGVGLPVVLVEGVLNVTC